ncbi:hypothetical protein D3C87_1751440 [compost metagenome]
MVTTNTLQLTSTDSFQTLSFTSGSTTICALTLNVFRLNGIIKREVRNVVRTNLTQIVLVYVVTLTTRAVANQSDSLVDFFKSDVVLGNTFNVEQTELLKLTVHIRNNKQFLGEVHQFKRVGVRACNCHSNLCPL